MIYTKEARELLQDFFGHSYHVYSMDEMIETIPLKEYSMDVEYVRLNDVIERLRTASKCIHDVTGLVFDHNDVNYDRRI